MAPFGSSSDSNTIKRGGLLTVLHIFSKKFRAPCKSAPPEATAGGDAAPETGGAERSGEGLQAGSNGLGPLRGRAAEGRQQRAGSRGPAVRKTEQRGERDTGPAGAKDCPARQTVQRGGTARRAGRGKRQPGAADRATRRAERDGGRMLIVLRARRVAR